MLYPMRALTRRTMGTSMPGRLDVMRQMSTQTRSDKPQVAKGVPVRDSGKASHVGGSGLGALAFVAGSGALFSIGAAVMYDTDEAQREEIRVEHPGFADFLERGIVPYIRKLNFYTPAPEKKRGSPLWDRPPTAYPGSIVPKERETLVQDLAKPPATPSPAAAAPQPEAPKTPAAVHVPAVAIDISGLDTRVRLDRMVKEQVADRIDISGLQRQVLCDQQLAKKMDTSALDERVKLDQAELEKKRMQDCITAFEKLDDYTKMKMGLTDVEDLIKKYDTLTNRQKAMLGLPLVSHEECIRRTAEEKKKSGELLKRLMEDPKAVARELSRDPVAVGVPKVSEGPRVLATDELIYALPVAAFTEAAQIETENLNPAQLREKVIALTEDLYNARKYLSLKMASIYEKEKETVELDYRRRSDAEIEAAAKRIRAEIQQAKDMEMKEVHRQLIEEYMDKLGKLKADLERRDAAQRKDLADRYKSDLSAERAHHLRMLADLSAKIDSLDRGFDVEYAVRDQLFSANKVSMAAAWLEDAVTEGGDLSAPLGVLRKWGGKDVVVAKALGSIPKETAEKKKRVVAKAELLARWESVERSAVWECFNMRWLGSLAPAAAFLFSRVFYVLDRNVAPTTYSEAPDDLKKSLDAIGSAAYFIDRGELIEALSSLDRIPAGPCKDAVREWSTDARAYVLSKMAAIMIKARAEQVVATIGNPLAPQTK